MAFFIGTANETSNLKLKMSFLKRKTNYIFFFFTKTGTFHKRRRREQRQQQQHTRFINFTKFLLLLQALAAAATIRLSSCRNNCNNYNSNNNYNNQQHNQQPKQQLSSKRATSQLQPRRQQHKYSYNFDNFFMINFAILMCICNILLMGVAAAIVHENSQMLQLPQIGKHDDLSDRLEVLRDKIRLERAASQPNQPIRLSRDEQRKFIKL